MIIVSQNGQFVVNFDTAHTLSIEENWDILCTHPGETTYIGRYSSREKAEKVISAITNCYTNSKTEYFPNNDSYWHSIREASLVFRMPKDSEVQL